MSELSLHNASLEIGGHFLVREVSLSLKSGKLTAFVGRNGSGKTTVLRLLAGLISPTNGKAVLQNTDLSNFRRRELAQKIAFVPQDTHIEFDFTVEEIVAMGRNPHLGRFGRETLHDKNAIAEAMRRANVESLKSRLVTELSGGERQRVVLARSLATEAEIMLFDEPTASLDIAHSLEVLEMCQNFTLEGKTIGVAIHDLNAAVRFADEVVLMNDGKVFAEGATEEVLIEENINQVFGVCTDRTMTADGKAFFMFYHQRKKSGED